jgi:hypothetical protein
MQVFQMHLRFNLEEVNAGRYPETSPTWHKVAGDSESAVQLTSSGAPTIHMNGSQPVLKTKGRIHQSMGTFELA